ncbi:MAG TPA: hypothetical protein VNK04_03040 [Gemmataceae bacterium]|jgi:hypothetical protein|nr:hypothetical protein [Gemmataceae bacterium]
MTPMTEAEWLGCTDPQRMLAFLDVGVSDRKRRLFTCACCRRIWDFLDRRARQAVEVAERYADGQAGHGDLVQARNALLGFFPDNSRGRATAAAYCAVQDWADAAGAARYAAEIVEYPDPGTWVIFNGGKIMGAVERAVQAGLLREIVGNPFRRIYAEDSWLRWNDECVVKIARNIYEKQRFDDLPILADALIDAGCSHWNVIHHCQERGPHVRGCWVIDLLLGKD